MADTALAECFRLAIICGVVDARAHCSMGSHGGKVNNSCCMGDRSTSDVVVRLRTLLGRDEWLYCHSHVLIEKSKYFADRLSENWPTCQILDARNCVEVYCQDSDFDSHVTVLRLLYASLELSSVDTCHSVSNTLSVLQVAVELDCSQIIIACVNYLEAVPWEEPEEEEILRILPGMGPLADPILARLQPVNPSALVQIFVTALQFATSSPPPPMHDLKSSVQEQLEYMLTEDDDAPLLTADDSIKSEVGECVKKLLARFNDSLEDHGEPVKTPLFRSYLSDMSWAWQILAKLNIVRDFVLYWIEKSEMIVKAVSSACPAVIMEVLEVAVKVLDSIACGTVILATAMRLRAVRVWLPFVRAMKPWMGAFMPAGGDGGGDEVRVDGEIWQSLESSFVCVVLALPSGEQAEVLTEWLASEHVAYPDLTEAFEVWCSRSRAAKRRLGLSSSSCHGKLSPSLH